MPPGSFTFGKRFLRTHTDRPLGSAPVTPRPMQQAAAGLKSTAPITAAFRFIHYYLFVQDHICLPSFRVPPPSASPPPLFQNPLNLLLHEPRGVYLELHRLFPRSLCSYFLYHPLLLALALALLTTRLAVPLLSAAEARFYCRRRGADSRFAC